MKDFVSKTAPLKWGMSYQGSSNAKSVPDVEVSVIIGASSKVQKVEESNYGKQILAEQQQDKTYIDKSNAGKAS